MCEKIEIVPALAMDLVYSKDQSILLQLLTTSLRNINDVNIPMFYIGLESLNVVCTLKP